MNIPAKGLGAGARLLALALVMISGTISASGAASAADPWPRQFTTARGNRVVVYQPQAETLIGDTITGRAAVSWTRKGEATPKFGVVFFTARVSVDRDTRAVTVLATSVERVRFPGITPEREKNFAALLEQEVPKWRLTVSYDRLLENLKMAERERSSAQGLKHEPPKILLAEEPTVLVTIDGLPRLREVKGEPWRVVVNTPVLMIFDPRSDEFHLAGGKKWWYRAPSALGPWRPVAGPPADIAAFAARAQREAREEADDGTESAAPPKILVSTEPAELIVSAGRPTFTPVAGADLLFMDNTESDVVLDVASQEYYVLLSGRWSRSKSLAGGDWSYVAPEALPASFKKIPPGSAIGDVRASIPGTDEAEDAVLDAQLPQTAGVRRAEAGLEVQYDGEPQFAAVEGAGVEYAVNASTAVLRIHGRYYACDDGVWFVSDSPAGPWRLADSVPREELDRIPPSSPVYNVKYVTIYDATPDIVYVGYTPGYLGCYVWDGTVVWGTGWYYPPWIGPVFYWPWPWTWGFSAHYGPWFGWGFGITWSYPFFDICDGWGGWFRYGGWNRGDRWGRWHRRRWWGPGGYRPPFRVVTEWGEPRLTGRPARGAPKAPGLPRRRPEPPPRMKIQFNPRKPAGADKLGGSLYDRLPQKSVAGPRPATGVSPKPVPNLPNNVYAGKEGEVYRRLNDGRWQQNDGQRWKPSPGLGPKPGSAPRPDLDRDFTARQKGEIRSRGSAGGSFRPSPRPSPKPSPPPSKAPGRR